jgi:2-iminobutanoate/2-iminopropanoate deaminase
MRILKIVLVISSVVIGLSAQSGGKQILVRGAAGQPSSTAIRAGGFIYVSGMMATDVKGNITAQTNQIFQNLRGVLKQAGSSIDNIAIATVTLEQAQDLAAMDEVFREQFKGDPPARTTYIGNMVRPGALLEIAVTAIPNGGQRRAITPAGWMQPKSPYSYAIQSGDTLFLSGMLPQNMNDLSPARGDIATQTKKAMDNAVELLRAAGMSLDDTISSRVVLRQRVADFANMNSTYAPYWDIKDTRASGVVPGRPGRATVGLGLFAPYDMEVTFVAAKGSSPREVVIPPNPDGSPGTLGALPFSPAIKIGNQIWVSGTTGGTPENTGDIRAQTKENLTRLGRTLKAAGFDFKDVVTTEVWMTNVSQLNGLNEVFRETFPTNPPVRKVVGLESLGGGNALTEIALMAIK